MDGSLAFTALLMGLVGGPHCLAMCGAACAGIGQAAGERRTRALWSFQIGRVIGYAALGAVAGASMQTLGWLTTQSAALRPVWTLLHAAAIALGVVLIWQARQPQWLERVAKRVWYQTRQWSTRWGLGAPLAVGTLWAFLPCGLLYSALLVAALSGSASQGAVVMGLFAVGTSVSMTAGAWLWLRLSHGHLATAHPQSAAQWGVRFAGAALVASSAWVLWMGLARNAAPWCVVG